MGRSRANLKESNVNSMLKRVIATVVISAFAFAVSGGGVADAQKAKGGAKGKDAGGYQKVKTYDFSGDTIDGDLVKPDGEFVDTRKLAEHTSLIRVRQDFIKEIVKSAEDL